MELATEINKRARLIDRKINILIEINVSGEKTKNGITASEAIELIKNVSMLESISVKGLMTIAPYSTNPENSRPYFSELRNLRNNIIMRGNYQYSDGGAFHGHD